jgi:L-ascorbate metabolism protein UlaG (beta-lactamase superfamily)
VTRRHLLGLAALLLTACPPLPIPRDVPYHPADADLTVTRIVHGSLILELGGTRILVDPWLYSGFFIHQREPLAFRPSTLPSARAVLLTHGHAEHFDDRALGLLAERVPQAVAPAALADRLRRLGFHQVVALDWWERTTIDGITVTAVPARHAEPENGYVLESDRVRVYAAGDTRPFAGMAEIATAFPRLDVALLPIGGQRLFGVLREMGPEQAAVAAATLGAARIVPIGYGRGGGLPLFWYPRDPVASFQAAAAAVGVEPEQVIVLDTGESWHYYR